MIDWSSIDTVFLDMDGTLLDLGFDNYFWRELVPRRYAEARGLSFTDAQARITARYQTQEGALAWYCLDYWSAELGMDLIALKREIASAITVMPYAEAFLRALQALPVRVVLVTNAHPASLSLKMDRTGLDRFFAAQICSHELGMPKESSVFWTRLRKVEPFLPLRSVLIDDSLAVLQSARRHGIGQTIAIRRPDLNQPPRQIDDFAAVDDLRAVMPD
ncbi:GMP/IMP nucleotidase [Methylotetracoccus oryzae]|uniref:GMP/IMP nucleotidase n=1 Tax=Methylotetracoccus oryzae TaxID=1919059 RepID=UPI001118F323|nr:GMP/IMP nucleotidase [Methylotetracoccus oryzae]